MVTNNDLKPEIDRRRALALWYRLIAIRYCTSKTFTTTQRCAYTMPRFCLCCCMTWPLTKNLSSWLNGFDSRAFWSIFSVYWRKFTFKRQRYVPSRVNPLWLRHSMQVVVEFVDTDKFSKNNYFIGWDLTNQIYFSTSNLFGFRIKQHAARIQWLYKTEHYRGRAATLFSIYHKFHSSFMDKGLQALLIR